MHFIHVEYIKLNDDMDGMKKIVCMCKLGVG